MEVKFSVLGLSQTLANLDTLGRKMETMIVKASVYEALKPVQGAVRDSTYSTFKPMDGLIRKGWAQLVGKKVRNDVIAGYVIQEEQVVARMDKAAFLSVLRRPRKSKGKTIAPTKYGAFWWVFLEFGTKSRQTKTGANRGSVTARPWVAPSFSSTAQQAVSIFTEQVKERTDRAISELPKTL
jgi:hypothetical protein